MVGMTSGSDMMSSSGQLLVLFLQQCPLSFFFILFAKLHLGDL